MSSFEVHGTQVTVTFAYGSEAREFFREQQDLTLAFETAVAAAIQDICRECPIVLVGKKMIIRMDVSDSPRALSAQRGSLAEIGIGTANAAVTYTISLNPALFTAQVQDLRPFLRNGVPWERWYVGRRWYGKRVTFRDALHHEMRHYIHYIEKNTEGIVRGRENSLLTAPIIGGYGYTRLVTAIKDIARESYTKLFDTGTAEIEFSHDFLFRIKRDLQRLLSEQVPEMEYSSPNYNHALHDLAQYMSFMIAYSLMDQSAILNERHGLRVRDIDIAITRGLPVKKPPMDVLERAGKSIASTSEIAYLQHFENAARELRLREANIPITLTRLEEMRERVIRDFKTRRTRELGRWLEEWRAGRITTAELRTHIDYDVLMKV